MASLFFAWSLAEFWRIGSFESQTVDWIIISLGVFFITAAATQYAASKFRSNMEKIGAVSNLRLTAGDEKSVVRVAAKNRLSFKKAIGAVCGAILAIVLNLISARIYELLTTGS
jgi:hypothetical protein